jgi:hypothetical protein
MGSRSTAFLLVTALMASGCGHGEPAGVPFTKIDLPAGSAPVVLSAAGDALLIGVRRDGQPTVPGLLRRGPDGAVTEIPVTGTSPYGMLARWYSIAADGDRLVALGGERGGAHSNVRWSVWTGSTTGLTEKLQGFSVFGGWGAGELVSSVLTPAGPALIGSWQSAQVGLDVSVWTADGDVWTRQNSAGTALESTRQALQFAKSATSVQQGILIAGTRLTIGPGDSRQLPMVWRSAAGNTGWTATPLPDAGKSGVATAARCWDATCAVTGSVDGRLAVWHLTGDTWTRLPGAQPIPAADDARLAAPIDIDGTTVQMVSDGGQVKIARADNGQWTARTASGPTGTVTEAVRIGGTVYILAGADEDNQTLWRVDVGALR